MTVRVLKYEPDCDVVPQAIIWRPLRYFTLTIRDGEDGLDKFKAASFMIGNDICFDLRVYRGHPEMTVTLYLPEDAGDEKRITEIIDIVIRGMLIPMTAIAWRRGQPFEIGAPLERPKGDRLHESEARALVLKIAAQQPKRAASTEFLKKEVPKYIELSPLDRAPSKSRAREQVWQQIVGNVISHRKVRRGPFAMGFAVKTADGIAVTPRGMAYLNSIGFSPSSNSSVLEA
jgi:hypothetical protein